MAKSHTRKKSNKQASIDPMVQQVTALATSYIKQWTNRELVSIQLSKGAPVCLPTRSGYKIGLYKLTVHKDKSCSVHDHNQEFIHTFDSKISAILYTIYTIKRHYWKADEIMHWDREINTTCADQLFLSRTIDEALKKKDYFSADVRRARLHSTETRLNIARNKISKIHKTAKYNKVWE
jgi:hypothetical protein